MTSSGITALVVIAAVAVLGLLRVRGAGPGTQPAAGPAARPTADEPPRPAGLEA